jgi:predicted Zn-dependent peptidase
MTRLGKATVTGTEIVPIEETERRIEDVTAEDIAALARDLYAPELLSAAGIGPSEKRFRAAVERVNPGAVARAA